MIDVLQFVPAGIIGVILILTGMIKALDKANKFTRFYPLIPLVLGVGFAFLWTNPWAWKIFGYNVLLFACGSSYVYKVGKTTILGANSTPVAAPPADSSAPAAPPPPGKE
jgi:hypothetical protein